MNEKKYEKKGATSVTEDVSSKVGKRASLHEKAVQAVARGEVPAKPTRRRRPATRVVAVVHIKEVDPAVMRVARSIKHDASNAYSRIEIRSINEVVVR